ncbi:MAG: Rrf2 family transcriptional regulator [Mariprofundales bacterium]|nr:Rrf2 family transcriptional regulator [Mariprofundales bacterium]
MTMRLNNRGRYALSAIIDLVLHVDEVPVSLKNISERQLISSSYLEQIFRRLRESGLVTSRLGAHGGYAMGKGASEITVSDVLRAVDEQLTTKGCVGDKPCRGDVRCNCHLLWEKVDNHFEQMLERVTLQDIVDNNIDI